MMTGTVVCRLVDDPKLLSSDPSNPMIKGSIAYNSGKDESSFMNYLAFGKTASIMIEYCKKGKQLFLSGEIRQSKWKTEGGQNRSEHQFVINRVEFIGKARENSPI